MLAGAHGQTVLSSDMRVKRDGQQVQAPEASANYTRPAATIAKEFHRRVMTHADTLAVCDEMRERLAQKVSEWEALRAHCATLSALGYTFDRMTVTETYSAKGWRPGTGPHPYTVTVHNNGRVTFDASCNVSEFAAVLGALGAK
jgi:hypothetical protein